MWLSRLPYDFPSINSGLPICSSTFLQPLRATMYLPGLIDWALHGKLTSPAALRQVGFFVAFIWVGWLAYYLNVSVKINQQQKNWQQSNNRQVLYVAGFIIAIFSVGVFPVFLITNRGEQLILPSVVLLIALFLAGNNQNFKEHAWQKVELTILYFVAISLILHAHPKGLFLTPLFILVGWQLFGNFKSRWPFILAMAVVVIHLVQNYYAFKYAYQCGELPSFEAEMKSFSLDPASLFYSPGHFFDQAYHSLIKFPNYLYQLGFREQTDTAYLPNWPIGLASRVANVFIWLNFAFIFLLLMILLPFTYYRKDFKSGRVVTINLVLLVLFWCVVIGAIFNIPKHWYDAGYIYALLLIIAVFFIGENFSGIFQKDMWRKVLIYLGIVTLLSQVIFIHRNFPSFWAGYGSSSAAINLVSYTKRQNSLAEASQACNIDPIHSKKVVVDDYTYNYLEESKWPMSVSYIFGNDDKFIRNFFSKKDSDGLMIFCTSTLDPYLSVVKKRGHICCISKKELKNLPVIAPSNSQD
jgi:hypothetical protein